MRRRPDPKTELASRLLDHLAPLDATLRAPVCHAVAARAFERLDGEVGAIPNLVQVLVRVALEHLAELRAIEARANGWTQAYQAAAVDAERKQVLSAALRQLVRERRALAQDLAALTRWFDLEALLDRVGVLTADRVDHIEIACRLATSLLKEVTPAVASAQLGVARLLRDFLEPLVELRRPSVQLVALELGSALLAALPLESRLPALGATQLRLVRRWLTGSVLDSWSRVQALRLLSLVDQTATQTQIRRHLQGDSSVDGAFVRHHAVLLIPGLELGVDEKLQELLVAEQDASEHVRQALVSALVTLAVPKALAALARLCREDASPRVRAFALRELGRHALAERRALEQARAVLRQALALEANELVLRVALEQVKALACGPFAVVRPAEFVPALQVLAERSGEVLVEPIAATLRELEVAAEPVLDGLCASLRRELRTLADGAARRVRLSPELSLRQVERALGVAARGDLGVSLHVRGRGRYLLRRGERQGLRAWRLLHEWRFPVPDKRPAFPHSRGRRREGDVFVPPVGMAEVTPTRVPGERQFVARVGGWGAYLPMVDDLLAVTRLFERRLRIVTSLGTVVLHGPKTLGARLRTWFHLQLRYPEIARLRQGSLEADLRQERADYTRWLKARGFALEVADTDGRVADEPYSVLSANVGQYFFSATFLALPLAFDDILVRFLSPKGSTAWDLAWVVWVVFASLVVRGAWIHRSIEGHRRSIPLSIGGWGTRGKSGTERLKAALFHGLRYDVVVKTTGCEAMFIHARRDLPGRELFLYRPYDKATIWEQRDVLTSARRLRAQVFLWECMALQPRFVDILNREWMQNPIITLTNAYPDHEDVMGPSGEDVARVIARFVPKKGVVFTSEDQMLPLIAESARAAQSELVSVDALDAELLPLDLLKRFPYSEHPRNMALVLALAAHWGIPKDRALQAMADHVVPDLGVLKTFPTLPCRKRQLIFSNGMSANERAGFMSNWLRLGFDALDPGKQPECVTVAVINNRADRVPRSRVFAEIFVRDANVEHMILIGGNLEGLRQFMEEALDATLEALSLPDEEPGAVLARADVILDRLKIPSSLEVLAARAELILGSLDAELAARLPQGELSELLALGEASETSLAELRHALTARLAAETTQGKLSPEELARGADPTSEAVEHLVRMARGARSVRQARQRIAACLEASDRAGALRELRSVYRKCFLEKVHPLTRYDAPGDQVIDFITDHVPPGHTARVLGCQNIKGTGLDFIYRWVSNEQVQQALARLLGAPEQRLEALRWLAAHTDYGLLDCAQVIEAVRRIEHDADPEWQPLRPQLAGLANVLAELERTRRAAMQGGQTKSRLAALLARVEPLVDHLDSIGRRKLAHRVMEDLFAARIGQGRAAILLRDVTARGKGGWLAKDVAKRLARGRAIQAKPA